MIIHKQQYSNVIFFAKKDRSFIAWVSTILRPINIEDGKYIYKEGDEIEEVYFLVKGAAGYVLPRYDNKVYLIIEPGEHFGHVDLSDDASFLDDAVYRPSELALDVLRRFTA